MHYSLADLFLRYWEARHSPDSTLTEILRLAALCGNEANKRWIMNSIPHPCNPQDLLV